MNYTLKIFFLTFLIFACSFGLVSIHQTLAATPDTIPDLTLWLDASEGVTTDGSTPAVDGELVQQWDDQSGEGNHAVQLTSGNRPTFETNVFNGQPTLRFATNKAIVTSSFLDASYNTAFTFFIVANKANDDLQVSSSNQTSTFFSGRQGFLIYNSGNLTDTQTQTAAGIATTSLGIETFRYNGSMKTLRFNGFTRINEAATGNLGLSGALTVGARSSNDFYYSGDIAEVLIYNRALTDSEVDEVEEYLATKYGLTITQELPQIVFEGDSMTSGVGSTGGQTYPQQTIDLLGGSSEWYGLNQGTPSETVQAMSANAASTIDNLYDDSLDYNILSFWGGTNDIFFGADAATTYSRIVSYAQGRQSAGFEVIVSTILPRSGGGTPGTFEADRQLVNTNIRDNWETFADALSDIASDSRIGDAGDETDGTYYSDNIHLTNAGYAIIAEYVEEQVDALTTPVISSIASTTADTEATITWTTDEDADSTVEYGETTAYGMSTTSPVLTTSHGLEISGLASCTSYHYRVSSSDAVGNMASSTDQIFTTTGCVAPTLSSIAATVTDTSATITWTTDELADSTVEHGATDTYGMSTTSATMTTAHSLTISGLSACTTYHYRVRSTDGMNDTATSSDQTFTTSGCVVEDSNGGTASGASRRSSGPADTTEPQAVLSINEMLARIAELIEQVRALGGEPVTGGDSCPRFITNHQLGDTGGEVSGIQTFLTTQGLFTYPEITDYYGPITETSVRAFQSAHASEILTPLNLTAPTGNWFESTRAKANAMVGCVEGV